MKATGKYPTKSAAILAMKRQGMTERQIGRILNIKPNTVSSMAVRAARREKRPIDLGMNIYLDLQQAAAERGKTPHELATSILIAVISDDLFNAVLDEATP